MPSLYINPPQSILLLFTWYDTSLAKGIVPSQQIRFDALLECHRCVRPRLGGETAGFFRLHDTRAMLHLEDLADHLARTSMEDAAPFQVTVLLRLDSEGGRSATSTIRLHVLHTHVEARPHAPSTIPPEKIASIAQEVSKSGNLL